IQTLSLYSHVSAYGHHPIESAPPRCAQRLSRCVYWGQIVSSIQMVHGRFLTFVDNSRQEILFVSRKQLDIWKRMLNDGLRKEFLEIEIEMAEEGYRETKNLSFDFHMRLLQQSCLLYWDAYQIYLFVSMVFFNHLINISRR